MKKSQNINDIRANKEIKNRTPDTNPQLPKGYVATLISKLPASDIQKLLLANEEAVERGDNRSLLDVNKLISLLPQVNADLVPGIKQGSLIYNMNAEELATIILRLAGLRNKRGDVWEERMRADHPDLNKAKLVAMGREKLLEVIVKFETYQDKNPDKNLSNIAILEDCIKKVDDPISEYSAIKDSAREFKTGKK